MAAQNVGCRILIRVLTVLAAALLPLSAASAQVIRGEVAEAGTGGLIPDAAVMATRDGTVVEATISDSVGRFELQLPEAGAFELHASRLGYGDLTLGFEVGPAEIIQLQIVLEPEALALDPITARATRGRIAREATIEGMRLRRESLPRVGPSRVFVAGDPEFDAATTVGSLLDTMLLIGRTARGRCIVWFMNGLPLSSTSAPGELVRGMSPAALEGLEYYRDQMSAPLDFQGHGCFRSSVYSVVAVWFAGAR